MCQDNNIEHNISLLQLGIHATHFGSIILLKFVIEEFYLQGLTINFVKRSKVFFIPHVSEYQNWFCNIWCIEFLTYNDLIFKKLLLKRKQTSSIKNIAASYIGVVPSSSTESTVLGTRDAPPFTKT